jgi:hypothetical protein
LESKNCKKFAFIHNPSYNDPMSEETRIVNLDDYRPKTEPLPKSYNKLDAQVGKIAHEIDELTEAFKRGENSTQFDEIDLALSKLNETRKKPNNLPDKYKSIL